MDPFCACAQRVIVRCNIPVTVPKAAHPDLTECGQGPGKIGRNSSEQERAGSEPIGMQNAIPAIHTKRDRRFRASTWRWTHFVKGDVCALSFFLLPLRRRIVYGQACEDR